MQVDTVESDLCAEAGADRLQALTQGRQVGYPLANAGQGLGNAFAEQVWEKVCHVIDTSVTGTVYLVHRIAHRMPHQDSGKILFIGSIEGFMPGTFVAT